MRGGRIWFMASFAIGALAIPESLAAQRYKPEHETVASRPALVILEDCVGCHSLDERPGETVGPTLSGLYGREIASIPGFPYTPQLAAKAGIWQESTLMGFLEKPNYFSNGTDMHFAGLPRFRDRKRLIDWFKAQTDISGVDMSVPQNNKRPRTLAQVLARGRPHEGARLFGDCRKCHNSKPEDPHGLGSNLYGLIGRPVSGALGYAYRDQPADPAIKWTPEALYRTLLRRQRLLKGSHTAFWYIDTSLKRAHLVAYIASLKPADTGHSAR